MLHERVCHRTSTTHNLHTNVGIRWRRRRSRLSKLRLEHFYPAKYDRTITELCHVRTSFEIGFPIRKLIGTERYSYGGNSCASTLYWSHIPQSHI